MASITQPVDYMTTRQQKTLEWQTWMLGAFLSILILLLTWGYQNIRSELESNHRAIQDLQSTGAIPVREKLADHEARINSIENMMMKNDQDHAKILSELQVLRETLIRKK